MIWLHFVRVPVLKWAFWKRENPLESREDLCAPSLQSLWEQTPRVRLLADFRHEKATRMIPRMWFSSLLSVDRRDTSKICSSCSRNWILKMITKRLRVEFTFSFIVLWFFFVFFRNCFRLPDDMYSVMKITWDRRDRDTWAVFFNRTSANSKYKVCDKNHISMIMLREEGLRLTLARPSLVSAQYLWNFTIFACSKCMRLSNTAFTFSWKDNKQIVKWESWCIYLYYILTCY